MTKAPPKPIGPFNLRCALCAAQTNAAYKWRSLVVCRPCRDEKAAEREARRAIETARAA